MRYKFSPRLFGVLGHEELDALYKLGHPDDEAELGKIPAVELKVECTCSGRSESVVGYDPRERCIVIGCSSCGTACLRIRVASVRPS